MARWVAIFEDDPAAAHVRKEHGAAHEAYLAANMGRIVLAGGLRPAPGAWFEGGLWVLEAADRDEALRLVEGDPFFRHGLRRNCRIALWGKADCYGEVAL